MLEAEFVGSPVVCPDDVTPSLEVLLGEVGKFVVPEKDSTVAGSEEPTTLFLDPIDCSLDVSLGKFETLAVYEEDFSEAVPKDVIEFDANDVLEPLEAPPPIFKPL